MNPRRIEDIVSAASQFDETLKALKKELGPADFWYPWGSIGNFVFLEQLLQDERRDLLALLGPGPIADIGGADGDCAFFLASLGLEVDLIDNPPTNFNHLEGARRMARRLDLPATIHERNLDSQFALPRPCYSAAFFLGILYHLKNPFYALERLSYSTGICFLSTRIARFPPDRRTDLSDLPLAYLVDALELNNDPSNYWIFTDAGLKRLISRAGWDLLDYRTFGATTDSDPVGNENDERAFCVLRSRRNIAVPIAGPQEQ